MMNTTQQHAGNALVEAILRKQPTAFLGITPVLIEEISRAVNSQDRNIRQQQANIIKEYAKSIGKDIQNTIINEINTSSISEVSSAFAFGQAFLAEALADTTANIDTVEEIENALRDPKFSQIVSELVSGEKTTSSIASALKSTAPEISRKLSKLRKIGVIDSRRQGREVYSRLNLAAQYILKENTESSTAPKAPKKNTPTFFPEIPQHFIKRPNVCAA